MDVGFGETLYSPVRMAVQWESGSYTFFRNSLSVGRGALPSCLVRYVTDTALLSLMSAFPITFQTSPRGNYPIAQRRKLRFGGLNDQREAQSQR